MSFYPFLMGTFSDLGGDWTAYLAYVRSLEQRDGLAFGTPCGIGFGLSSSRKRCRAILIGWLLEVGIQFAISPTTIFFALQLLDRRLAQAPEYAGSHREQLQLLGCAALLVATKVEEITPPAICDYIYISGKKCTAVGLRAMEHELLVALDYGSLGRPVVTSVTDALTRVFSSDYTERTATMLLLVVSVLGPWEGHFTPTEAACGAQLLAQAALSSNDDGWIPTWPPAAIMLTNVSTLRAATAARGCAAACAWVLQDPKLDVIGSVLIWLGNDKHVVLPRLQPFITRAPADSPEAIMAECGRASALARLAPLLQIGGPATRTRARLRAMAMV
jgi:hypothetical protein